MQPYAIPCSPMQSHAVPCSLTQSHAVSCSPMQSHAVSFSLIQSHAVSYSLMQSHAVSCSLMQSHAVLPASIGFSSIPKSWESMENVQNASREVSRAVPGRSQRVDLEFWDEGATRFFEKCNVQNGSRTLQKHFLRILETMISTDFLRRRFAT